MEMSKNLRIGVLLDLYGRLLTERQYEMMNMYYNDDLSLSEIAEQYQISRQGVHDAVRRSEETLEHYDEVLGLADIFGQHKAQLCGFKKQALAAFEECRKGSGIKTVAESIIVLLESLDDALAEYENTDIPEE